MVPDIDLQLQASLKALADNIAPAVDPANKVATEQLGLVMATLAMVRARLPIQRRFTRRMLEDAIALADALGGAGHGLGATIDAARAALADPELESHELEAVRAALTSATVAFIAELGGDAPERVGRIVLDSSRAPIERLRAWCLPSGFEGAAPTVAAIETLT